MKKVSKKQPTKLQDILKDPIKIFYEALFWVGLLVMVGAYFYTFVVGVVVGLILIFLSLFVYELHHKEEEEKKKKGRILTYIFFALVVIAIVFLLYGLRYELMNIIQAPISKSWLLYLLLGLFLADLAVIVYHLIKSKKKDETKPRVVQITKQADKLKPKKQDKEKIKGKIQLVRKPSLPYTIFYLVGLLIFVVALFYRNWTTMVLGFVLAFLSLLAYRLTTKPAEQKIGSLKTKSIFPKNFIKKETENKEAQAKLWSLLKAQKKAKEEGKREEKILKELEKKKKQEEKLLQGKEKLRRKEEKRRLKEERAKRKQEKKELKKLQKAKERLKGFEERKEKLKKKELLLLKRKEIKGESGEGLLEQDLAKLKNEVKKVGKYETDFDKLYGLIERYGVVRLAEASEIFGISREKAEGWAHILESHNLAVMHYPPLGGPELRKIKQGTKKQNG